MKSAFQTSVCEFPDINASNMAVDATGRFALVSGRKGMLLVDLDGESNSQSRPPDGNLSSLVSASNQDAGTNMSPSKTPICKRIVRNSKYEPTACHFNRHMTDLFGITTYQSVEVFSIENIHPPKPRMVLKGHSRAVADIEWSHFDPYLLGSSSADCLTNLWDIRDSRRPSATLTSVCGATQVRFSKTSGNLVATSHEIDVRIWDIRQHNLPLYYIAAHLQKINGMDWDPMKSSCDQEQLITCSQDQTIKLWDLNGNKIKPSANFSARPPAWRVRYSPVSPHAILTSTLPQLKSRNECLALKLWSIKPNHDGQKELELILGLVGHTDVIVDFDWRPRPASSSGCELVSWSKDQTLRTWKIDQQFIELHVENAEFDCEPNENTRDSIDATEVYPEASNNTSSSIQEIARMDTSTDATTAQGASVSDQDDLSADDALSTTNELKQEFNLINKNIPNVEFEELNSLRRVCLVTARAKNISCRLRIALPPSYPHEACPTFTIIDSNYYGGEFIDNETKEKLYHLLNETARSQLSRGRNCIEPCLRKFIAALQKITGMYAMKRRSPSSGLDNKDDPITISAQRDHSVPFPPTSGAKFCGNLLVCFGRPMLSTLVSSPSSSGTTNWLVETPRSMAQLSAQLDNLRRQGLYNLSHISISYFYYGAMRRADLQQRDRVGKSQLSSGSSRTGSKYINSRAKSVQSFISKSYKCGPVLVYDVADLLGGNARSLAVNYVFDKDVIKMCRQNASVAAAHNRKDLVQVWSLAELSSEGILQSFLPGQYDDSSSLSLVNQDSDFGERPWTMHPFGSKLIQSLIDHYVNNCHDVQTAAMLIWTFSSPKLGRTYRINQGSVTTTTSKFNANEAPTVNNLGGDGSNSNNPRKSPLFNLGPNQLHHHHTVMPSMLNNSTNLPICVDNVSDEWNFVNVGPEAHIYSNSWSNSTIHEHLMSKPDNYDDRLVRLNILNRERGLQNDLIMHIYAEHLYRLNLLNQRAMILKNIGSNSIYSEIFGNKPSLHDSLVEERLPNLAVQCYNTDCLNECRSAQCQQCKKYSLFCSICRLPVRGSSSVCLKCLHGGHVKHYDSWFSSYDFCPTGCGCKCLSSDLQIN